MTEKINLLLGPLEKGIKKYKKYIGYLIIFLSFCSLLFLFEEHSVKESGEKAILVLWIILWIPIFARVFGIHVFRELLGLRKELGILMGTLAIVHSSQYLIENPGFIFTSYFWVYDGVINFLAFGFFALLFTVPLTLTSNNWSMKVFGKYWKYLHRSVYIIAIFTVAHVVLLKWSLYFEFVPVIILVLYFIGKFFEWKGIKFYSVNHQNLSFPKGQKWICIPCGYIYDPLIGDTDSGIEPGTEFIDIPDNWKCPECGVTKSDFIPYEENKETPLQAIVVKKTYLNPTTLELIIESATDLVSLPGQYIGFLWKDDIGEFSRSYSIVRQEGRRFTFTIKLGESGRGAKVLREIHEDSLIKIRGVFGKFLLKDSLNPKIFVATGTGLAPIYNMLQVLEKSVENVSSTLYFSVGKKDDLFYQDKLTELRKTKVYTYTTREEVEGCIFGRVNIDSIQANPQSEWYLCGNPKMVQEAAEKLANRGMRNVYSEEFGL